MEGYFHQLAERALRPTSAVHSIAALPYSRAPEPPPDRLQAAPPFEAAPRIHASEAPDASRTRGRTASEASHVTPILDVEVIEETLQTKQHEAESHPATLAETRPFRDRALQPEPLHEAGERPPRPRLPIHVPIVSTVAGAEERPVKEPVLESERASKRRPAPVAPLRAAPTGRQTTATSTSRAARDSAPEVHIHIGRIELTAVPAPATPRRERPAERKPMSLDEYLGRSRTRKGAEGP